MRLHTQAGVCCLDAGSRKPKMTWALMNVCQFAEVFQMLISQPQTSGMLKLSCELGVGTCRVAHLSSGCCPNGCSVGGRGRPNLAGGPEARCPSHSDSGPPSGGPAEVARSPGCCCWTGSQSSHWAALPRFWRPAAAARSAQGRTNHCMQKRLRLAGAQPRQMSHRRVGALMLRSEGQACTESQSRPCGVNCMHASPAAQPENMNACHLTSSVWARHFAEMLHHAWHPCKGDHCRGWLSHGGDHALGVAGESLPCAGAGCRVPGG